ncbi:MAG: [protein-PII] uridylyltransferase [Planctomycetaceae bacterium]|nr:[protein-PII] uridylyltransferase [Planctomycetaceae bacterium]
MNKRIRDDVVGIRNWVDEGRQKLFQQHRKGSPGIQVCTQLNELLDTLVLEIFEAALASYDEDVQQTVRSRIALVPHGGYGRREMAPYSDIDLMLLHTQGSLQLVAPLARRLVRDFSDTGIDLGFSLRTIGQACQMSARDPIIFTSLVDSRFLGGSVRFFRRFVNAFDKSARRSTASRIRMVEEARREERAKYGETVYLLEPNVKRSRGGLRDLQLMRWIGFIRYRQADPAILTRGGHLDGPDYRRLRRAQDFLLKLRNELHFHAKSSKDVLYRDEQVRIAELFGYQGSENVLPVEEFMQDYFKHTSAVRQIVAHFIDGARWRHPFLRKVVSNLTSHHVGGDFRVGQFHISATRTGLEKVTSNLADVLRIMDLAGRYNCRIDHPTWRAIRTAMMSRNDVKVDRAAAESFLSLLSQRNRLGRLLRRLHELRVLEKLVPGFSHARCLLQFNEYHKYTVDEHSLQAVEQATGFAEASGTLGRAYNKIKRKYLLHLALLVHDLGKGFPRDHSEVGAEIAVDVAKTLYLSGKDTETLTFLVRHHLMLSHLAFRRDTSDESIVIQHAAQIGTPSQLRMLFVLTCADLAAVGPDVLNDWKVDVLAKLYQRMMRHLSGETQSPDADQRLAEQRDKLLTQIQGNADTDWLSEQIESLPGAYLEGPSASHLIEDLERLKLVEREKPIAWGRYLPDRQVVEYSIGFIENSRRGSFHRLTGALSGKGMEILTAEIHSLANGLCLDRFYVNDQDYRDEPPVDRFREVEERLLNALTTQRYESPTFRQTWQSRRPQAPVTDLPIQVRVDNTTSDSFTIIDVFAHDRPGLLYAIAKTLFDLDLSVAFARIGTYLDQVVDVFYVTDSAGNKVQGDEVHDRIRGTLTKAIELEERKATQ